MLFATHWTRTQVVFSLIFIVISTIITHPTQAASIQVGTIPAHSTSPCTLSDAVATAQTASSVGACVWAGDADITLIGDQTYALTTALPAITGELTIRGPFLLNTPAEITWQGDGAGRLFEVASHGSLKLINLKLTGGQADTGGAVLVHPLGSAELTGVVIEGSSASYAGGAIYNQGSLILRETTLKNNSATLGSALYNGGQGTFEVSGSLVVANTGLYGAIYQNGGQAAIRSSTFSANQAYYGGAFYGKSGVSTSIDFSTFRNNDSSSGVGGTVFMEWGTLQLQRSALTAQPNQTSLCWGHDSRFVSLAGNALSDGTCGVLVAGDQVVNGEIQMSELLHHGGRTEVHVPLCERTSEGCQSPVIDKVTCCAQGECPAGESPARDQRNQFPRRDIANPSAASGGDLCDIGAYESVCEGTRQSPGLTTVLVHEYQVTADAPTVLLDNGACFTHQLFQPDPEGCRIQWRNYGVRLAIRDVLFVTPDCTESCFPDATACAQLCADDDPTGWIADPDHAAGTFAFDVPGCNLPSQSQRYLLLLEDLTDPSRAPWHWDPLTEVVEDDVPET